MVVFQSITGYKVVYPRTTGYIVVFSQDNKSYHGNWLYSSMSPKTCYIVTFPPDNWLNGSMSMDNWLYCCLSPGQLAIMTYLVSSRRSIEIWGVVKNIGYMVVFQLKNGYIAVYPPDNWTYSSLSPRQLLKCSPITENCLYSSMPSPLKLAI